MREEGNRGRTRCTMLSAEDVWPILSVPIPHRLAMTLFFLRCARMVAKRRLSSRCARSRRRKLHEERRQDAISLVHSTWRAMYALLLYVYLFFGGGKLWGLCRVLILPLACCFVLSLLYARVRLVSAGFLFDLFFRHFWPFPLSFSPPSLDPPREWQPRGKEPGQRGKASVQVVVECGHCAIKRSARLLAVQTVCSGADNHLRHFLEKVQLSSVAPLREEGDYNHAK